MNNTQFVWRVITVIAVLVLAIAGSQNVYARTSSTITTMDDLTWVRLGGPLGGLGYDIRMMPGTPEHMYVTDAAAGVHISSDGGRTWLPSNEGISTRTGESSDAIPVFSLTIDPNDVKIIWAGTQFLRGIFKSTDGGNSWKKMDRGITENNGITFRGFTIQPGNSDVVYAGAEISSWAWKGRAQNGREFDLVKGVVYKTTNGGKSWKAIWRGNNLVRYIWIDPRNPDVLYVSTGFFDREAANSDPEAGLPGGEGILKSTDGGKTWTNINNGLGNLYVGSLSMQPGNPDVLLAGTGNNAYAADAGVYLTTDGGQSWTHTLSDDIITAVELSAVNPQIAYAGSSNYIYRSEDGGRTWGRISGETPLNAWGSPGTVAGFPLDFEIDPTNPDRIFANQYGGGNFLSEDAGVTWSDASSGYTGAYVRAIAVHPSQPGQVLAGARSGFFISYDGGAQWRGVNTPPARMGGWEALTVDPSDPLHILAGSNINGQLFFSRNGGQTWETTNINLNGERVGWRAIAVAPSDPSRAYAGSAGFYSAGVFDPKMPGKGVYVSQDGGKTWQPPSDELMLDAHITGLIVAPGDPRSVFAASIGKGILHSSDGGQSWEKDNKGLRSLNALSIAMDPSQPTMLLAGFWGAGLYRSSDGGATWKQSGHGIPPEASVTSIVFNPADPQIIFASDTRSGVYRSEDGGNVWKPIINGLRMRSVNKLAISSDGWHLYAATEGEGVYRLDLNGQPPAPAPLPEPSLPTPVGKIAEEVATPISSSTPVSSGKPFCGGAALLPLGFFLLAGWRRTARK